MNKSKLLVAFVLVAIVLSSIGPGRVLAEPPPPHKGGGIGLDSTPSVSIQNSYIKALTSTGGRFILGTTYGDPGNSTDDNKRLLYGYPTDVGTGFSTLRIMNGASASDYRLGNTDWSSGIVPLTAPYVSGNAIISLYEQSSIRVQEKLSFVPNPDNGRLDTLSIEYQLTNLGAVSRDAGIRVMLDTMIGSNDGAPIFVPGWGRVTQEQDITSQPDYWIAWESANFDPAYLIAKSQLKGTGITSPSRIQIAAWPRAVASLWDFTVDQNQTILNDSAVIMYYNPATIAPGQSRTIRFYYGIINSTNGLQLAPDVDQFIRTTNQQIEQIVSLAGDTATVGDYYIDKSAADQVQRVVNLVFNGVELITAGVSWAKVGKGIQHIATPGYQVSKYASWRGWTDSAVERHWGKALYDTWQGNREVLTKELMKAGGNYYAREAAKEGIQEFTNYAAQRLVAGPDNPVADLFGNPARQLGRGYESNLLAEKDSLITQLAVMNFNQAELDSLRNDMAARLSANQLIVNQLQEHHDLLWDQYQQSVADENNWLLRWGPVALKWAAVGVATALWDGPGFYIASLGTAALSTAIDAANDSRAIALDEKMATQALSLLNGRVSNSYIEVANNSVAGLNTIRSKSVPEIASAQLFTPYMYSYGHYRLWPGLFWMEDSSDIQFSIGNAQPFDSSYLTSARFQNANFWSGPEHFFVEGQSIDLSAYQSGWVSIPFKIGENGVSPNDNTTVNVDVLATSDTGLYPGASFSLAWNPTRIEQGSSLSKLSAAGISPIEAAAAPTLPNPLSSVTTNIPGTLDYQIAIQVINPFDIAVDAVITQQLPAGVTLVQADGAALLGSQLSWSTNLSPHTAKELRPVIHWEGIPGQVLVIPSPELSFKNPADQTGDSYTGTTDILSAAWPIETSADYPFTWQIGNTIPVRVGLDNLAGTGYSGTLTASLVNADGVTRWSTQIPFTIGSSAHQMITLNIAVPRYMESAYFKGVVKIGDQEREIFSDLVIFEGIKVFMPLALR
jgi:hypothetical protein